MLDTKDILINEEVQELKGLKELIKEINTMGINKHKILISRILTININTIINYTKTNSINRFEYSFLEFIILIDRLLKDDSLITDIYESYNSNNNLKSLFNNDNEIDSYIDWFKMISDGSTTNDQLKAIFLLLNEFSTIDTSEKFKKQIKTEISLKFPNVNMIQSNIVFKTNENIMANIQAIYDTLKDKREDILYSLVNYLFSLVEQDESDKTFVEDKLPPNYCKIFANIKSEELKQDESNKKDLELPKELQKIIENIEKKGNEVKIMNFSDFNKEFQNIIKSEEPKHKENSEFNFLDFDYEINEITKSNEKLLRELTPKELIQGLDINKMFVRYKLPPNCCKIFSIYDGDLFVDSIKYRIPFDYVSGNLIISKNLDKKNYEHITVGGDIVRI